MKNAEKKFILQKDIVYLQDEFIQETVSYL